MAGFPNSCSIVVRVTEVQPQRAIVAQDTSHLPQNRFLKSRDILLRRFFPPYLIINPCRATVAA